MIHTNTQVVNNRAIRGDNATANPRATASRAITALYHRNTFGKSPDQSCAAHAARLPQDEMNAALEPEAPNPMDDSDAEAELEA